MFSRAHLLIQRDYEQILEDQPWGIEVIPEEDNIFKWTVKIFGLLGSEWEGGIFRMIVNFDEHYNYEPPQLRFHTIPFHPNIDKNDGVPCIDFLNDLSQWNEKYTMCYILVAVQSLLCNPVMENAINEDAVEMMSESPHDYRQIVKDCIVASRRFEGLYVPSDHSSNSDSNRRGILDWGKYGGYEYDDDEERELDVDDGKDDGENASDDDTKRKGMLGTDGTDGANGDNAQHRTGSGRHGKSDRGRKHLRGNRFSPSYYDGLDPYPKSDKSLDETQQQNKDINDALSKAKKTGKVAFEDYYNTWCGIATSKSHIKSKNLLLENLKTRPDLQRQHYGLTQDELKQQLQHQLKEHEMLMYGKFRSRADDLEEKQRRAVDKVNHMRKIYLQPRTPGKTPFTSEGPLKSAGALSEEPWEKEVDDLIAWTNDLDKNPVF